MARKASVIIEKDEHGFYAWCPELKGCQSQGDSLEEAMANVKEAIELSTSRRCRATNAAIC
jgi:predicted RNase H-like HicB family nuclease